jgi:Uncharacterized protein conserved in bacteria
MKAGDLKFFILIIIFFFKINPLYSEEKINLNILQPTYEEESELEGANIDEAVKIKSKKKQLSSTGDSIVKFRALDKITAKTKDINIVIGKKKRFGYLEILPRKCSKFQDKNNKGVAAYIQVRDLSDEKGDKIFVFNGWTFSPKYNTKNI